MEIQNSARKRWGEASPLSRCCKQLRSIFQIFRLLREIRTQIGHSAAQRDASPYPPLLLLNGDSLEPADFRQLADDRGGVIDKGLGDIVAGFVDVGGRHLAGVAGDGLDYAVARGPTPQCVKPCIVGLLEKQEVRVRISLDDRL